MDRTDFVIIDILQKDARTPVKAIAERVGLAVSSTHARIKALRDSGVLRGAHADVDQAVFGVGVEALFMIELAKHERGTVDAFLDDLLDVPEIRSAYLVTGRHDLVVHVVARDTAHLKDLALDRFTNRPGVARIETAIVYDSRRQTVLRDLRGEAEGEMAPCESERNFERSARPRLRPGDRSPPRRSHERSE